MDWIVLIVSGAMEAVWATALGASEGFSKPLPTIVFFVGLLASMAGLSFAVRTLPTGLLMPFGLVLGQRLRLSGA